MTSPILDPFAPADRSASVIPWATDQAHVRALCVLRKYARDEAEFRELALMLGYGTESLQERTRRGIECSKITVS